MGTTAEKLQAVLDSKEAIKSAINAKGGNVDDVLSTYADAITNLPSGGGGDTIVNVNMSGIGNIDMTKYNFLDYDGTLLYSLTDEELDALTELPTVPDHTDDNLTFQEWNWDLEHLKNVDRNRPDRPIVGANLVTNDGMTYIDFTTDYIGNDVSIHIYTYGTCTIYWDDDNSEDFTSPSTLTHTYTDSNPNKRIRIKCESGTFSLGSSSSGSEYKFSHRDNVTNIKLGNNLNTIYWYYIVKSPVPSVNIPKSTTFEIDSQMILPPFLAFKKDSWGFRSTRSFDYSSGIRIISWSQNTNTLELYLSNNTIEYMYIPTGIKKLGNLENNHLKYLYFPDSLTTAPTSYQNNSSLEYLRLPSITTSIPALSSSTTTSEMGKSLRYVEFGGNITSIPSYCFFNCYALQYVKIPDSVTSIGSDAFTRTYSLTLDLSEQTKVISLTSDIVWSSARPKRILIPSSLLEDYKTAPYWSKLASVMVGV